CGPIARWTLPTAIPPCCGSWPGRPRSRSSARHPSFPSPLLPPPQARRTDLELGARENPMSHLVDIAVLAEPDEFDKGAIVHYHGCADAFRRRPGRIDDFLALESSLEVIDFECHMGHGLDELGQGTGLLEPHPLHAVGAGTETRHVETILSEMNLSWVLDV